MKKQILVIVLLSALYVFNVNAQILEPVKWTYSTKKISDDEVQLIFKAKIEDKWYMYSQFFPDGGPVKMTFSFKDSKNYKRLGKVKEITKPKVEHDDIFEIDVQYFEKTATLIQKIKVLSEKDFVITGNLSYQVCYEDKCVLFDPDFEFSINGK